MSNLDLWKSLQETDPQYVSTKDNKGLSSINTQYFFLRATEAFGSCGIGWGYEILDERLDDGVDVYKVENNERVKLGTTKNHTIKIKLWYKVGSEKGEVTQFGHTPYIYSSKWGLTVDDEAPKKSLSDAIKKALSMIGVAADIYLKHYDNPDYVSEIQNKVALENADNKDAERVRQIEAHNEWKEKELKALELIPNAENLKLVWTKQIRKLERMSDKDGVIAFNNKYKECLAKLEEK